MSNKVIKIVTVLLLSLMVVATLSNAVLATMYSTPDVSFTIQDSSGAQGSVNSIIGAIISIVQVVGVGVAIIMLIVLAIKYISAAPGDKADIKKHAVVYVVGAIVLFAAGGILQIIKNFASMNVKATS